VIALYPGSFDPVTLGHTDVICRVAKIADRLIVAVAENPYKTPLFTAAERVELLQHALHGVPGVEVTAFSGLLAEYAQKCNATAIIRGLRDGEDFINEARYAWHNRLFDGGIETLFFPADPAFSPISSRIVKEAAAHIYPAGLGDDVLRRLVPENVCTALKKKYTIKG
jgi:pantetheine-phosphate adenylyltransferase